MSEWTVLRNEWSGLKKSKTGINGFDELTNGGLPLNRTTILIGATGTGKTIMALEYILHGAMKYEEPGVFMTFEEKLDDLHENMAGFGYDLKQLIHDKKILVEHLTVSVNELVELGRYNIEELFVRLKKAIDQVHARRVVLDSFDTLFSHLDARILKTEFMRLFQWLKDEKVTALITAEMGGEYLTRLGLEEKVADCVIELNNRIMNQIGIRRIRVVKYRGSFHANNEYPFIIDEKGMTIFPLIQKGMEQPVSQERVTTGIASLDKLLDNKGFYIGSSILVSGTAGTGKTSMASQFAQHMCQTGKKCLYSAFEESPNQILRNMKSIGILLQPALDTGILQFYYARPTLQNLELHFMAIKEHIDALKPEVVVLDPITNLMTEGLNSDVRSMLIRFIDFLKARNITVLFTAAITIGSIARNPSDEGISSMVDSWLMLQDSEVRGERHTTMYIMKSRGMYHSRKEMQMRMKSNGISFTRTHLGKPILRNDRNLVKNNVQ